MRLPWTKQTTTTTRSTPKRTAVDTVADYKQWVASGDALADARAAQVTDPLSNPDTVTQLRDTARATSLAEIKAQHAHRMHQLTTADRHRRVDAEAEESQISYRLSQRDRAIDRLRRIDAARAAHDPATAAADEVGASARRVRRYLVVAWVMSALAATGIAASMWLSGWSLVMSIGTGLAAEIGLTYLASSIIADQSAMSQRIGLAHDTDGNRIDVALPKWTQVLPWAAVAGLLAASISVNVYGLVVVGTGELGYLGAIAAVVAALATLLAWGHARQSAAIVIALLSDASIREGEAELDEIASGTRIPRHGRDLDRDSVLDAIEADATLLDEVLAEVADRAVTQMPAPAPRTDIVVDEVAEIERDNAAGGVAVESVEPMPEPLRDGAQRAAAQGASNRDRVLQARAELAADGDEPSVSAIARATGLDRRTVRRHLS